MLIVYSLGSGLMGEIETFSWDDSGNVLAADIERSDFVQNSSVASCPTLGSCTCGR